MLLRGSARAEARYAVSATRAVWILAVTETVSWGLLYYSFGVLLAPMAARVQASEAEVSGAFSLALLAAGVTAPVVGSVVDRHGAGVVLSFGSVAGALGFAALSVVSSARELFAVWACLGVAHACTSYEPAFTAVTRWFDGASQRRRALLAITSFAGFASTIFVPLAAWLIGTLGLSASALVFAALLAGVVTPLHLLIGLVPERAEQPSHQRGQPPPLLRGASVRLAFVFAIHAIAAMGAAAFLFPALVEREVTVSDAALLTGLAGAAQVPARLLYEPMCRLLPARSRFSVLLVTQALSLAGWATLEGGARVVALMVFGAANGLTTLERASVIGEWFGLHAYGTRSGWLAAGSAVARAAAPVLVAVVASQASYTHAFVGLSGALMVAAALQVRAEHLRAGARQRRRRSPP